MITTKAGNRLGGSRSIRQSWQSLVWAVVALLCGIALAVLPLQLALAGLLLALLCILSLIDTRVALIVTLVIAPLKILTETELPFAHQIPLDIGQIALICTFGIWLTRSIADNRRLNLRWTPMIVPLVVIIVTAALSLWSSFALWSTLKELFLWVEMLAMVVLVVSLMGEGSAEWLVVGLVAAGCVQAIIGIYEFRGGSGATHLWILDYRYFRAFGSFGQPNPFGAFMGLILSVALGTAYGSATEAWDAYRVFRKELISPPAPAPSGINISKNAGSGRPDPYAEPSDVGERPASPAAISQYLLITGGRTALYGVAAAILGAGLIVSWSRGAWLGFGAAAAMLVFFAPRRRWIGAALVGIVVVGLGIGLVTGLAPASLVNRLSDFSQELTAVDDVRGQQISDANYAVLERLAHWQAAVGMATDHPWLGVGFGAYEAAYPQYALLNWPLALGHAHNYYLNLLAETGLIGLVGYLAAWIAIVGMTLRVLRRETGFRRGVALGILGAWTHLAVHSFFDKLYVNNLFLHLGVMLGLIGGFFICEQVYARQQRERWHHYGQH
ncbi:MAG: O-antigen ligase family protein [Chloroflexota bacterium]